MHPARAEIFKNMILGIVKAGSVQFRKIAETIDCEAKVDSIIRRIQRFFQLQNLPVNKVGKFIFRILNLEDKIIFTLDRTNWQSGFSSKLAGITVLY